MDIYDWARQVADVLDGKTDAEVLKVLQIVAIGISSDLKFTEQKEPTP